MTSFIRKKFFVLKKSAGFGSVVANGRDGPQLGLEDQPVNASAEQQVQEFEFL
jgi:hypothetical protein